MHFQKVENKKQRKGSGCENPEEREEQLKRHQSQVKLEMKDREFALPSMVVKAGDQHTNQRKKLNAS